jgi:hypothetical protein
MKAKFINNILVKALLVICSPVLILLLGLIGFCMVLFSDGEYDEF